MWLSAGWAALAVAVVAAEQLVFQRTHQNATTRSRVAVGGEGVGSCGVPNEGRIDCGFLGINKDECERNGCCWAPVEGSANVPWCFNPLRLCQGYAVHEVTDTRTGLRAILKLKQDCRMFGNDVRTLRMDVDFETDTRVHVKITDASRDRYEVPEAVFKRPASRQFTRSHSQAYRLDISNDPFGFKVTRRSDGEVIFDTTFPGAGSVKNPLIFEEQYMEISTSIPQDANIFGLGEVVHALRRDPHNTRQTMWARDAATPVDENVYGVHPFYMELRNGKAHGVFLLNSNGMDVMIRSGALTYKVIGGVLDFYIFVGPKPADVVHQYYEVIGHPHMIPYWVLGFHHCRYGYKNLDEVKEVVRRYGESKIPLETMWTDIDYMDSFKDFTFDPNNFPQDKVKKFIGDLKENNQHYVLIFDPAIKAEAGYEPFEEGQKKNIFIRRADGNTFIGKVWPGLTAFPDFLNPDTQDWWSKWIGKFMKDAPISGLWIDMNEPANFCDGDCYSFDEPNPNANISEFQPLSPPYKINNAGSEAPLKTKTVSPDALHHNGLLEYDVHNLYGHSEAIMTYNAVKKVYPGKRTFILSRSSFPSTGVYAGHWTGDNWSTWEHLYLSIPAMLSFQMFGIPLVGADICGFIGDVSEELCARWMQLGAFYPFSRNHNTLGAKSQEPYLWESVATASRNALAIRYAMLPYYYTLFYQSHKFGSTVVRPMFFEFPEDKDVAFLDRQFLVGAGILITPVLKEGARQVDAYFASGKWYDWYTHSLRESIPAGHYEGKWVTLDAGIDHIPVHIRGGHIIPLQQPAMTTFESRKNNFELLVALDESMRAHGDLFLDDGLSDPIPDDDFSYINFSVAPKLGEHVLSASGVFRYKPDGYLETIYILGLESVPTKVLVNDRSIDQKMWSYDSVKKELIVKKLKIKLTGPFSMSWK